MGLDKFQNITAILFDLDNTLINTKGADRIACEHVFQYLHNDGVRRSIAREVVDKFYDFVRETPQNPSDEEGDVDAWRLMLWKQALGPGLSGRAAFAYSIWKEVRTRHLSLAPGLEDLLLGLRRQYKLGLVTNGSSECQWEKIRRVNGSAFFDAIVVSGDFGQAKPCTAIFEEAFRLLDVSALECVMVGDRLDTDIAGAVRANCAATIWFCPDAIACKEEGLFPRPDFTIQDLRDIVDLLPERKGFSFLCQDRVLGLFHSLRDEG